MMKEGEKELDAVISPLVPVIPGPAPANDCSSLLWVIVPRFHLFHLAGTSPPSDAQPFFFCKGLKSCQGEHVI